MAYLKKVAVVNSTTFVCRQVKMCHISVLKIKLFILAISSKFREKKAIKPMPCASLKIISRFWKQTNSVAPNGSNSKCNTFIWICLCNFCSFKQWLLFTVKLQHVHVFISLLSMDNWVTSIKWRIFYLHFSWKSSLKVDMESNQ